MEDPVKKFNFKAISITERQGKLQQLCNAVFTPATFKPVLCTKAGLTVC